MKEMESIKTIQKLNISSLEKIKQNSVDQRGRNRKKTQITKIRNKKRECYE